MLHKYYNHGQIKENELVEHVAHIRDTDNTNSSLTGKKSRRDILKAVRDSGTKCKLKMQDRNILVVWLLLFQDKDRGSALAT
jgi:hypothetical protein